MIKRKRWTPEEDALLREVYPDNVKSAILKKINKDWAAIHRRAIRLNLHRNEDVITQDKKNRGPRKDAWTPEEEKFLTEIYHISTKKEIISKFKRPWKGIRTRAYSMGLVRDKGLVLVEMQEGGKLAPEREDFWTENEIQLLKDTYECCTKKEIQKNINRSWMAIRLKARMLHLNRDKEIVKQDNLKGNKEAMLKKYGVEYSTQLPAMKEKSRQTNLKKLGVEYPSQSPEVKEKIKKTVRKKYGVDNVFQSQEIKEKSKETTKEKYGVEYATQSLEVRQKTKKTNKERYGVENTFQLTDLVKKGMISKHGVPYPQKSKKIREKTIQTNINRYGVKYPSQNDKVKEKLSKSHLSVEVKRKKYETLKKRGFFTEPSNEEKTLLNYLIEFDDQTETQKQHPLIGHVIDFYMPLYDLWVQYDGAYWHGKDKIKRRGRQAIRIEKTIENDKLQNKFISNLIRFWSDDVKRAIKNSTITNLIENKIKEKVNIETKQLLCPKNSEIQKKDLTTINSLGRTRDRKTKEKMQYIIDNYKTKNRSELAKNLNETSRWIKRQLNRLLKEKAIKLNKK